MKYALYFMLKERLMGFQQVKINILMISTLLMWLLNVLKELVMGFFMHGCYLFKMGIMCISLGSLQELLVRKAYSDGDSGHFDEKRTYELLKKHFF